MQKKDSGLQRNNFTWEEEFYKEFFNYQNTYVRNDFSFNRK